MEEKQVQSQKRRSELLQKIKEKQRQLRKEPHASADQTLEEVRKNNTIRLLCFNVSILIL